MLKLFNVFCVGVGGFIGASFRYIITIMANKLFGNSGLPYGTLISNVVGAFFIGLIFEYISRRLHIAEEMKLFIITGLLGGLTTFSTFSHETVKMLLSHSYLLGTMNIFLNVMLSIIGVILGKYFIQCIVRLTDF